MKKIFLVCSLSVSVFIHSLGQQIEPRVGIIEKLGHSLPMDVELYDESGHLVQLRTVLKKPTVLMFVYYKCPGICSPLLSEVAHIVETMDLELGKDYEIITVSFDHTEEPELAGEKKENYLGTIKKAVNPNGWRFFTGDSTNIQRLTDSAGFYFERSGRDWIHAGALIAISPEGKVTRYLYGIKHLPLDVKLAIMEAAEGRTGPTIAKVLSFCYSYDPEGKQYTFNFVRIGGLVTVGLAALFVVVFIVRKPKKS